MIIRAEFKEPLSGYASRICEGADGFSIEVMVAGESWTADEKRYPLTSAGYIEAMEDLLGSSEIMCSAFHADNPEAVEEQRLDESLYGKKPQTA